MFLFSLTFASSCLAISLHITMFLSNGDLWESARPCSWPVLRGMAKVVHERILTFKKKEVGLGMGEYLRQLICNTNGSVCMLGMPNPTMETII